MSTAKLRYFVRLDSKLNIVPGSLIARRKGQGHPNRPGDQFGVEGNWLEVFNPSCCAYVNATPTGTPTTNVTVTAYCNGSTALFTYTAASTTFSDTVTKLNTNFPGIATWSTNGTVITATLPVCRTFTFTVVYS